MVFTKSTKKRQKYRIIFEESDSEYPMNISVVVRDLDGNRQIAVQD